MAGKTGLQLLMAAEKKHKYFAKKTVVDGINFPSKAEARRYTELKLLERAGKIEGLKLQPKFELMPGVVLGGRKKPPLRFTADFSYCNSGSGVLIVEDVKGGRATATSAYRMRLHMMKHVHDIEVTEVQ